MADEKDEGRFSHFGIEILNFIGGGIYFLGEKLGLFYVGKGPLNGPRKEGEKTLVNYSKTKLLGFR